MSFGSSVLSASGRASASASLFRAELLLLCSVSLGVFPQLRCEPLREPCLLCSLSFGVRLCVSFGASLCSSVQSPALDLTLSTPLPESTLLTRPRRRAPGRLFRPAPRKRSDLCHESTDPALHRVVHLLTHIRIREEKIMFAGEPCDRDLVGEA